MNIYQAKSIDLETLLDHLGAKPDKVKGDEVWYYSPLRVENTPSFHIKPSKRIWFDFGIGKGGDVIDFAQSYLALNGRPSDVTDALKWLASYVPVNDNTPPRKAPNKKDDSSSFELVRIGKIEHPALISYIHERAFDPVLALVNLKEAHIRKYGEDKTYFGLAFANDNGGYEFRNKFFKSTIGKKGLTTIKGSNQPSNTVHVFEGFSDYLTYLTMIERPEPHDDAIVLNSLSFHPLMVEKLAGRQGQVLTWYDNDKAGRQKTTDLADQLKASQLKHRDMAHVYQGFNDLNDYVMSMHPQ